MIDRRLKRLVYRLGLRAATSQLVPIRFAALVSPYSSPGLIARDKKLAAGFNIELLQ